MPKEQDFVEIDNYIDKMLGVPEDRLHHLERCSHSIDRALGIVSQLKNIKKINIEITKIQCAVYITTNRDTICEDGSLSIAENIASGLYYLIKERKLLE